MDTGDTAADHHNVGMYRDAGFLQRLMQYHPLHRRRDQRLGFLGAGGFVQRNPADMFANIGHLKKKRVAAALGHGSPERWLMHQG